MFLSSIATFKSRGHQKRKVPGHNSKGSRTHRDVPDAVSMGESVREEEGHPAIGSCTKGCAAQQQRTGATSDIVVSNVITRSKAVSSILTYAGDGLLCDHMSLTRDSHFNKKEKNRRPGHRTPNKNKRREDRQTEVRQRQVREKRGLETESLN
jgi:hypothetical protein